MWFSRERDELRMIVERRRSAELGPCLDYGACRLARSEEFAAVVRMSLMLGYGESIGSLIVVSGGRLDESDVRGCVVFLRGVCVQQLSEA